MFSTWLNEWLQTIPLVRGQKQRSLDKEDGVSNDAEKNVSKKAAAAHTYDYFRDKWDKFDVVNIGLLPLVVRAYFGFNCLRKFSICEGRRYSLQQALD